MHGPTAMSFILKSLRLTPKMINTIKLMGQGLPYDHGCSGTRTYAAQVLTCRALVDRRLMHIVGGAYRLTAAGEACAWALLNREETSDEALASVEPIPTPSGATPSKNGAPMAELLASYHPERCYDLYSEADYRAEGASEPFPDFLPTYALRGKCFYWHARMDNHNRNIGMAGLVVTGDTARDWRIMAGNVQLGEILSDGRFWRTDGERFRLVEVLPRLSTN